MKAQLTDVAVLSSLKPQDICNYLLSKGAFLRSHLRDVATVWIYDGHEIVVPNDVSLGDYSSVVFTAISKIEKIEDRSQLDILRDMQNVEFDVVRVRNSSVAARKGTIPLSEAIKLIANTREMLLSAACSEVSRKISYPARKPQQAEDYIKRVRLGQTEVGSFVITVLSPIPPKQLTLMGSPKEEYEEKIVPSLHDSLKKLNSIAKKALEKDDVSVFLEGAPDGITSNLCDAVVALNETAETGNIDIGFFYSYSRINKIQDSIPVFIERNYIPIIREASKKIKEIEPQQEQELIGFVVGLNRGAEETAGQVTILDVQPGRHRNIKMTLEGENYSRAVNAHEKKCLTKITGTIVPQGRGYTLEVNSDLYVFPAEPCVVAESDS